MDHRLVVEEPQKTIPQDRLLQGKPNANQDERETALMQRMVLSTTAEY
jgi:hypothetical protein